MVSVVCMQRPARYAAFIIKRIEVKIPYQTGWILSYIIVKMQNICNLISWNSVHISDIFNCYSANINGMWNARKHGGIYKTFNTSNLRFNINNLIYDLKVTSATKLFFAKK